MEKKCCFNCRYFHLVHEYVENGEQKWFDSLLSCEDKDGNDISANSCRCTKFSETGDSISMKTAKEEGICDEFTPIVYV